LVSSRNGWEVAEAFGPGVGFAGRWAVLVGSTGSLVGVTEVSGFDSLPGTLVDSIADGSDGFDGFDGCATVGDGAPVDVDETEE
jgi:hypothetical protein